MELYVGIFEDLQKQDIIDVQGEVLCLNNTSKTSGE